MTNTLITVAPTRAEAEKAAVPALPVTLDELVITAKEGATWSATGIGRTALPVMFAALSAGGHLRVGTVTFAKGRPVTGNAELVERAATLATIARRPPVDPGRAPAMLGVSGRS